MNYYLKLFQKTDGHLGKAFCSALACLLWLGAFVVQATERYVVEPGTAGMTSGAPYNAWTNAATNIQSAITASSAGDTIWVTNGTYYAYLKVDVNKALTIKSVNGYANTIICGSPGWGGEGAITSQCIYIHANAVVDGFTMTNGHETGGNGGGNVQLYQGAIQNCLIVNGNTAGAGGGIHVYSDLTPGALCCISNCIIKKNRSDSNGGGGICLQNNNTIVVNCLITENYSGGGVDSRAGGLHIMGGGGACKGTGYVANCTIVANTSQWAGGIGFKGTGVNTVVYNCISYSNKTIAAAGSVVSNDLHDFTAPTNIGAVTYSCASYTNVFNGAGLITNHPLFIDYSAGNWRLGVSSPCVNRGTNLDWMTGAVDLDGRARIRYGIVDMGAYECVHEGTFYRFY